MPKLELSRQECRIMASRETETLEMGWSCSQERTGTLDGGGIVDTSCLLTLG